MDTSKRLSVFPVLFTLPACDGLRSNPGERRGTHRRRGERCSRVCDKERHDQDGGRQGAEAGVEQLDLLPWFGGHWTHVQPVSVGRSHRSRYHQGTHRR